MENKKIVNKSEAVKVELNDHGDFIVLTANSATFFDKYVTFFKELMDLTEETHNEVEALEKEYTNENTMDVALKISKANVEFSYKATEMVDNFLGKDTVYKYFKELYDNVEDFVPDADCFIDFIENINPIVEEMYGKKIEIRKNIDKNKVSRYQPQDFKKKGSK